MCPECAVVAEDAGRANAGPYTVIDFDIREELENYSAAAEKAAAAETKTVSEQARGGGQRRSRRGTAATVGERSRETFYDFMTFTM